MATECLCLRDSLLISFWGERQVVVVPGVEKNYFLPEKHLFLALFAEDSENHIFVSTLRSVGNVENIRFVQFRKSHFYSDFARRFAILQLF